MREIDWPFDIYDHASALEFEGRVQEASELYNIVLNVTEDAELQSEAHYNLGRIAKSIANEKLANRHFHKAMQLNAGSNGTRRGVQPLMTGRPCATHPRSRNANWKYR
jgi:hypothetical protein